VPEQRDDLRQALLAAVLDSGLSLNQLALRTGLPYATVHGFINSDVNITLASASRLTHLLGLELRPVRRRKDQ